MSIAHLIKYVVDSLWAQGGIGAAAELGLEYCQAHRAEACPVAVRNEDASPACNRRR